jgi:NAD-specific glutamate dehydrogenase
MDQNKKSYANDINALLKDMYQFLDVDKNNVDGAMQEDDFVDKFVEHLEYCTALEGARYGAIKIKAEQAKNALNETLKLVPECDAEDMDAYVVTVRPLQQDLEPHVNTLEATVKQIKLEATETMCTVEDILPLGAWRFSH